MRKLIFSLIIFWMMPLFAMTASGQNENVSIQCRNTPVSSILEEIESKTDVLFVYKNDVDVSELKTLNVSSKSVKEVLDMLFEGRPVLYDFAGKHIILYNGPSAVAKKKVTGIVTDDNGDPFGGVTVMVRNTDRGVVTDIDGKFSISASDGEILVFSCLGFEDQEVEVKGNRTISLSMIPQSQMLDELVFVGYGSSRKRDLTGSVTQVKSIDMEKEAPRSVADILRGGVAGLTLGMANTPAGTASIQIRGKNTLTAGSSPLLVLDGVIYNGELTDINPNDIESIDVLKDASSVAIYGAKASNGVIAISTKRGTIGKPKISFNANVGLATPANIVKVVDGAGFIKFRQDYHEGLLTAEEREASPGMYSDPRTLQSMGINLLDWYNYTQNTPVTELPEESVLIHAWLSRLGFSDIEVENYMADKETDWDKELFQVALQQDYTVSVSNRNDKVSYYLSLGYANREGTVVGRGYENFRGRINVDSYVTKWLTVGVNAQYAARNSGWLSADVTQRKHLSPYAPNDIDDPDSAYRHYPNGNNNCINPFYDNHFIDRRSWNYDLSANIYAKVALPFGIEYQFNISPRQHLYEYYNHKSDEHESWAGNGGESERTINHSLNWQIDNILKWNKSFGQNRFDVTLLQNAEKNRLWSTTAQNKKYSPNDVLSYHAIHSGSEPTVSSNDTYSTGDALMARVFYSYADKYMLTASVRRDGYSAFGQKNPRATFPSVALGWVFSNEKFMERAGWLDFGKLRVSYGINGNRDIGIYAALAQLSTGKSTYMDENGKAYMTSQVYVSKLGNKSLKWEKTAAYNIGLDYSLLDGAVDGSFDFYKSTTTDLLVSRTLPKITGFDDIMTNLGCLSNYGFEMSINAHPISTPNFKWDTGGTFYFNRRKIVSLYGDMKDVLDKDGNVIGKEEADDYTNQWFIGRDPDQIWNYERNGVWQLGEEDEAIKYGCQPGDFRYVDQDDNGMLDSNDKIFQGYTTPRFQASWRNEFKFWNNLTLTVMMYGKFGHYGAYNRAANVDKMYDIYTTWDIPRWTYKNPTNDYARLGSYNAGSNYVRKDFVRIESLTMSYSLPKPIVRKMRMESARLSFAVRNPFVFTTWKDGDVEGGDYTFRTFNFSINVTL